MSDPACSSICRDRHHRPRTRSTRFRRHTIRRIAITMMIGNDHGASGRGHRWRRGAHDLDGDRATEFKQRCDGLGIKGVSLHSYRYAWAERAKTAGYPERYAQVNLGHNSRAMARAYSRKAPVEMPSLSEYERQQKAIIGNRNTEPAAPAVAA